MKKHLEHVDPITNIEITPNKNGYSQEASNSHNDSNHIPKTTQK